eukprot:1133942-Prymnesium_polylepis.1
MGRSEGSQLTTQQQQSTLQRHATSQHCSNNNSQHHNCSCNCTRAPTTSNGGRVAQFSQPRPG